MRIKICGLFREQDIDYVNEARPDYVGFVFAKSGRQVSAALAQYLRFRLADEITPVGVFVNAPINDVAALFHNGTISAAQLHGDEDESYITQLKKKCLVSGKPSQIKVIKTIKSSEIFNALPQKSGKSKRAKPNPVISTDSNLWLNSLSNVVDYFLIDSGCGSGKPFDWNLLNSLKINKLWFLAGGINLNNIEKAAAFNPFAVDVSSGAETDGIKDREKILQLTAVARKGNIK
jgi:phosphoribosylanthranilate isomerase